MYLYFITDCGEKELIASTVATYEVISSTVDATGAETGRFAATVVSCEA